MRLNDTFISELDESKPKYWVWVTTNATVNNLNNQKKKKKVKTKNTPQTKMNLWKRLRDMSKADEQTSKLLFSNLNRKNKIKIV